MKPAIRVENLSKHYRIGGRPGGQYQTLRESLAEAARIPWRGVSRLARPARAGGDHRPASGRGFWALDDVSFEVQPGEIVGVIGRNGAGKSTLLKLLSRITEPTDGIAEIRGRVGSLLEVGTGFHPELTGRENIYLNGAILGMTRSEIRRRFDEIVAFAEIEKFLDTPVKRYSSGMYVRLAFSVAAHLETEILLVDEVLAVGDQAFQTKCLKKIEEVVRHGRTIMFVSHNMASIRQLCSQVIFLEGGRSAFYGDSDRGVERYAQRGGDLGGGHVTLDEAAGRRAKGTPIFRELRLINKHGEVAERFFCGDPLRLEIGVAPVEPPAPMNIRIAFQDAIGTVVFNVATYLSDAGAIDVDRGGVVTCEIDQLDLVPGIYTLELHAGTSHEAGLDIVHQPLWFEVVAADYFGNGRMPTRGAGGYFLVRSRWDMDPAL